MSSTLYYNEIYSRFLSKVSAYDFLDMSDIQLSEFMCNWLHSAFSKTYIRKLFVRKNGLSLDDEIQMLTYEMSYEIDDETDKEFLLEVIAYGLIVEWLSPKINNIVNLTQVFSSSDSKFFSQSAHLSEMRALRDSAIKEQRSLISDRGYTYNTYLDNEA